MSFGDPNINKVIQAVKDANEGNIDPTIANNRKYAHLLLGQIKKMYKEHDPVKVIERMITEGKKTIRGPSITSTMYLFYNTTAIINLIKVSGEKKEPKKVSGYSLRDAYRDHNKAMKLTQVDPQVKKVADKLVNKFTGK